MKKQTKLKRQQPQRRRSSASAARRAVAPRPAKVSRYVATPARVPAVRAGTTRRSLSSLHSLGLSIRRLSPRWIYPAGFESADERREFRFAVLAPVLVAVLSIALQYSRPMPLSELIALRPLSVAAASPPPVQRLPAAVDTLGLSAPSFTDAVSVTQTPPAASAVRIAAIKTLQPETLPAKAGDLALLPEARRAELATLRQNTSLAIAPSVGPSSELPPSGVPTPIRTMRSAGIELRGMPAEVSVTADDQPMAALFRRDRQCATDTFKEGAISASAGPTSGDFGLRLARVALAQTRDFVVYTDAYRAISFPGGDVPAQFGVCTDVIVRAYRALGIDLQALVSSSKAGTGDSNIDHRRTDVLRRFLTRAGSSRPISQFAEDFLPGDVVTYERPQNRHARSHIAIVSDRIAPSGRPMIIHNRGWGPQLEDALFVDRMTGHFRYAGPASQELAGVIQHGR